MKRRVIRGKAKSEMYGNWREKRNRSGGKFGSGEEREIKVEERVEGEEREKMVKKKRKIRWRRKRGRKC